MTAAGFTASTSLITASTLPVSKYCAGVVTVGVAMMTYTAPAYAFSLSVVAERFNARRQYSKFLVPEWGNPLLTHVHFGSIDVQMQLHCPGPAAPPGTTPHSPVRQRQSSPHDAFAPFGLPKGQTYSVCMPDSLLDKGVYAQEVAAYGAGLFMK